MKPLWNLVRKELRELLTKSSIISILVVVILLASIGGVIKGEIAENSEIKPVGYYNFDSQLTNEFDYSAVAIETLESVSPDFIEAKKLTNLDKEGYSILDAMNDVGVDSCVIIPDGFNLQMKEYIDSGGNPEEAPKFMVYYHQQSTSIFSVMSTVSSSTAMTIMSQGIANKMLVEGHAYPIPVITNPVGAPQESTYFNGKLIHHTPSEIYGAISSYTMFIPVIVMIVITMIGSILISSMGNEKENKTLETLLTLPLNRTTIVAGKLIGSAIAGLVMGAMYMIGMYFYVSGIATTGSGLSLEDLGISLGVLDWLLVAAMMFLAILCALGMCMILGAFAKNYKAAQTMVLPISVLAMIPMFVTMFTDFGALPSVIQVLLFIIPFTHPMMIIQNLIFGNVAFALAGLGYLVVLTAILFFITVRLYKSDILLTGLVKKDNKGNNRGRGRNPIMLLYGLLKKS